MISSHAFCLDCCVLNCCCHSLISSICKACMPDALQRGILTQTGIEENMPRLSAGPADDIPETWLCNALIASLRELIYWSYCCKWLSGILLLLAITFCISCLASRSSFFCLLDSLLSPPDSSLDFGDKNPGLGIAKFTAMPSRINAGI